TLSVDIQEALAKALGGAGTDRVRASEAFGRLLAGHAYLGQIDVNPLSGGDGKGNLAVCEFWLRRAAGGSVRVEGRTEVAGGDEALTPEERGDGRIWKHAVTLTWEGTVDFDGPRITR